MTNLDIVNEFKEDLINRDMDEKTISSYVSFATKSVEIIDEPIADWSIRIIPKLNKYLKDKNYADTTYNKHNMSFRIFLAWVKDFEYNTKIDLDVFFKRFKQKKITNKEDVGQKAMDYTKFEDFLNFVLSFGKGKYTQRARVIILLEMCGGLRRMETRGLKRSEINFEDNALNLVEAKFDKKRTVYVEDFVLEEIQKLCEMFPNGEYVICTDEGDQVADNQINRSVKGIVTKAIQRDIIEEEVSPHGLRKTYASWLFFVKKANAIHIQKLLGHANFKTTQLYLKTTDENIKDSIVGMNMRGTEEVIEPVIEEQDNEGREDEESII